MSDTDSKVLDDVVEVTDSCLAISHSWSYNLEDDNMMNLDITMDEGPEEEEELEEVEEEEEIENVVVMNVDVDEEQGEEAGTSSSLKMPKRKVKDPSPVWKCAEKVDGGAKCNICGKLYKCTGGNTKGIIVHLNIIPM